MIKKVYIYDLESFGNFFLAMFKNKDTGKYIWFEISSRLNQFKELKQFLLNECEGLVGFNNINYDYPMLHHCILTVNNNTPENIFKKSNEIINSKYSSIWDNQIIVPQLDLYKIWHYDNKNKATSLKWLEFAMRLTNVEDLPYKVGSILTEDQMNHVIEYCRNDIEATDKFYILSSKHIDIRRFYTDHENINLMNASEIRMSKEIFGKYLSKEMNISIKELNQLRTIRNEVEIKDIIFDYLKFNDFINQEILDKFKSYTWIDTSEMSKDQKKKYAITFNREYKNVVREYAEGGIHSACKPGIYKSDEEYILVDVDFASYYPHLSFRNKLHPEHIPEEIFNNIYEGFYKDRKNYDKKDPRNYVLKIILNGSYGLSKDKHAYLYDPKWQLAICINGQLILTLLTEKIFDVIPEAFIIFENTDGGMYRIPKSKLELLNKACKEVEEIVNIPLETQICEKIIIRDVNNYQNIITSDNIKFKGVFEIDRDYHKNHSKRIVPIALANYFINNIPVEQTIKKHLNNSKYDFCENYGIYDFCLGAKMIGGNKLVGRSYSKDGIKDKELSKMTRYYVSNGGLDLIKKLPPLEKNKLTETDKYKQKFDSKQMNIFDLIEDVQVEAKDREENLEAGYRCTLFNKYFENNYNINYEYYINECNKVINTLNN